MVTSGLFQTPAQTFGDAEISLQRCAMTAGNSAIADWTSHTKL
jgi:hypothetical protein